MTDSPRLATGWDADTPLDDTLVRRFLLHWAACCEAYAEAGGGATEERGEYRLADLRRPSGYFNAITLLQPIQDDAGSLLDRIDDDIAGGEGDVMLWSAWPTPDLHARGWELVGHPPLLARPPASVLPAPTSTVDLSRVATPEQLAVWEQVAIEGYPMPELFGAPAGAMAAPALLDDPRFGFWTGAKNGCPVSISSSFVEHGIASFALGVTRPEARRSGHWLAHASARLEHAPDVWTTGIFSDFSRPGAESIGFVPITRFTLWAKAR
jgi:hypothetical protein